MLSRAVPIACFAVLFVALLPACEDQASSTQTTTTQAPSTAAQAPESSEAPRVAALLPFAADQLIAMGVQPVLVPALRGGQPEAWQGIDAGALDHTVGPNIEQLIAADPDVVIMSAVYTQFVPQIEETTDARVVTMDADTLEDITTHTRTIGELVGKPERAEQWIDGFHDTLGAIDADAQDEPVSVLAVFGTPQAFYAFLPKSYLGNLVEHAGGELVTSDMPEHAVFRGLAPLSMEAVVQKDPDVLLVVFHGPEQAARAMLDRDPLWSQLSAVKGDHIAMLPDDLYAMRSGSEATTALRNLRDAIDRARPAR